MKHVIILDIRTCCIYESMADVRRDIPRAYVAPQVGMALREVISKMDPKLKNAGDIVILHITPWDEEANQLWASAHRSLEQSVKTGVIALQVLKSNNTRELWLRYNLEHNLKTVSHVVWLCRKTWKRIMTPDDTGHIYYCLRVYFPKKSRRKRS